MNVVIGISCLIQKLVSRSRPQICKIVSRDQGKGIKIKYTSKVLWLYKLSVRIKEYQNNLQRLQLNVYFTVTHPIQCNRYFSDFLGSRQTFLPSGADIYSLINFPELFYFGPYSSHLKGFSQILPKFLQGMTHQRIQGGAKEARPILSVQFISISSWHGAPFGVSLPRLGNP